MADLSLRAAREGLLYPARPGQAKVLDGLSRLLSEASYERLVIAGGPRVGKSTLAKALGSNTTPIYGTDDLIGLGWSEASLMASTWFDRPGPWIAEGVAIGRALRKWLARNPNGAPCDAALWLTHPVQPRVRGQHVMALGCASVWSEIRETLRIRGVKVIEATGN